MDDAVKFPFEYVNKAVSTFGKLVHWHRPRETYSRVLVTALLNDVASVPRSLVVKRMALFPGLGRSWSVPAYILNGRHTIPGLMGTEEPVPPVDASPQPD